MKLSIVLASSQSNAMPLTTTLRSIVETNRRHWPIEFFILHADFNPEMRQKIATSLPVASAELHWSTVNENLFRDFSGGVNPHVSRMAYARFLIPVLLPERVSRVLYLDTDVLVLEDLSPLWQTELDEAPIGAVDDFYLETSIEGLPQVERYFNSGVLLIDLKKWKKERISERAFLYLKHHPSTPFLDQDALNFVCDGIWKKLDTFWNDQGHHEKRFGLRQSGIAHFVAGQKPWLAASRSRNARLYDSFRSRTRFARTGREKVRDSLIRFTTGVHNIIKRGGFR